MPEMPEVEVMVDRLQKYSGMTIHSVSVLEGATDRYLPGEERLHLVGQKIYGVFRRGKFMIFVLDRGALLCHNAMSGYWDSLDEPWTFDYVEGEREAGEGDVRVKIVVSHPEAQLATAQCLRFHDSRKFGQLRYMDPDALAKKLDDLGPEMVNSQYAYQPCEVIDQERFVKMFQRGKKPIKASLMEQKNVTGLGNIYAAEALHMAGVDPHKKGRDCTNEELMRLFTSCQVALNNALDRKLDYSKLSIYRRSNCSKCGAATLSDDTIGGRTTYYCGVCQK